VGPALINDHYDRRSAMANFLGQNFLFKLVLRKVPPNHCGDSNEHLRVLLVKLRDFFR
jgi:hypothetical protein